MSILFDDIIFGPVRSRRLGISLGINLLPEHTKHCTLNCIYCECGWTKSTYGDPVDFHKRNDVKEALERSFNELAERNMAIDALTFAGNGEPTLHPEFAGIIDDTLALGKKYFPEARVVVLSNSTTLGNESVFNALLKVDNIMKLDAGSEEMFRIINNPMVSVTLEEVVTNLRRFKGQLTIQTLLLSGELNGKKIDNTSSEELAKWLGHLSLINPRLVMLYPVDRPTPARNIKKISPDVMEQIAAKVRLLDIDVKVYS